NKHNHKKEGQKKKNKKKSQAPATRKKPPQKIIEKHWQKHRAEHDAEVRLAEQELLNRAEVSKARHVIKHALSAPQRGGPIPIMQRLSDVEAERLVREAVVSSFECEKPHQVFGPQDRCRYKSRDSCPNRQQNLIQWDVNEQSDNGEDR